MTQKEEVLKQISDSREVLKAFSELSKNNPENSVYKGQEDMLQHHINVLLDDLKQIEEAEERAKNPQPEQVTPVELSFNNDIIQNLTTELTERYNTMEKWLLDHGNNCKEYNLQKQPNSTQRIYYNYGYQTAIDEVLKMLGV